MIEAKATNKKKSHTLTAGAGLAIGIAIGAGIGNLAIGIAIGVCLAVGMQSNLSF